MNHSVCFATVIFDENVKYFQDFIESLNQQTNQQFELLIFNDGVNNLEKELSSLNLVFKIITFPQKMTIAENRAFLLNFLKESDYTYCIFGDSDDYFPKNRVKVNLNYLKKYDIVVNDVYLVDKDKNMLVEEYLNIENQQEIKFNHIVSKNCLGLGNTAINVSKLPQKTEFNNELAAIDWMLFSRMLYEGKSAIYTNETYIYYRQHNLNEIGLKSITPERLLRGIKIKNNHYKNLIKEYNICQKEYKWTSDLLKYCSNPDNLLLYLNKVLSLNLQNPMWWEEVKSLEELNIEK